jgi:hypothetical protein
LEHDAVTLRYQCCSHGIIDENSPLQQNIIQLLRYGKRMYCLEHHVFIFGTPN